VAEVPIDRQGHDLYLPTAFRTREASEPLGIWPGSNGCRAGHLIAPRLQEPRGLLTRGCCSGTANEKGLPSTPTVISSAAGRRCHGKARKLARNIPSPVQTDIVGSLRHGDRRSLLANRLISQFRMRDGPIVRPLRSKGVKGMAEASGQPGSQREQSR
jgi:hypothetical protein